MTWAWRSRYHHDFGSEPEAESAPEERPRTPGKRTLVGSRYSARRIGRLLEELAPGTGGGARRTRPPGMALRHRRSRRPSEPDRGGAEREEDELAIAERGLGGSGGRLPYWKEIQRAFGEHDVSEVRAHTGQGAADANRSMSSLAYTMGEQVAFRDSRPDLFTAAHEAAHVVQQRSGAVSGGVGEPGDAHERHADQVAERVVRGESAEGLLDRVATPAGRAGPARRAVQRKVEAGAGLDVGTQHIKVPLKVEPSREIPCGKATLTFAAPIEATASLTSKAAPNPADVSGGGSDGTGKKGGGKVSLTVYEKPAKEAGDDELRNLVDQEMEPSNWQVEEVKWHGGGEAGSNEAGTGGKFEAATAVDIKFKSGDKTTVKATLFSNEQGSGMDGPNAELEHKFDLGKVNLWQNEDATLDLSGTIGIKLKVEPNWKKIFAELAAEYGKRGGARIAKNFLRATLRGLTGSAGFVAGGVITIFTFGASIIDAQEIEQTIRDAQKAVGAYARGYTMSWGMDDFGTAGPDSWYHKGYNDGGSRLVARAREVLAHPAFAPFGWEISQLTAEMKQVARDAGLAGDVYQQIEGAISSKIYERYVKVFYENQASALFRPDYIARQNAEQVARVLGVDADAVLPKPED